MPQLINRVPPGLLSLLGIQSTGQNPVLLADELRPIIDTTEAYYASISQPYLDVTAALSGVGFFGGAVSSPPAGQLWVFQSLQVAFGTALPVGTTYTVQAAIGQLGTGELLHLSAPVTGTAGSRPATQSLGPVYCRAGEVVGVFVQSLTLGTAAPVGIFGRRTVVQI